MVCALAQIRNANLLKTRFLLVTEISLLLGIQQPTMAYQATNDFVSKVI
jgi:hypothetical protein